MMVFLVIILVTGVVGYAFIAAKTPKSGGNRSSRGGGYSTSSVSLSKSEIATRWGVIMATSNSGAAGLKSSITEADKLVDNVLRGQHISGDTMGERLKNARSRFSDPSIYDALWQAHKYRNALAHEISFDLVPGQAKDALRNFERALKNLGAL